MLKVTQSIDGMQRVTVKVDFRLDITELATVVWERHIEFSYPLPTTKSEALLSIREGLYWDGYGKVAKADHCDCKEFEAFRNWLESVLK